MFKLFKKENKEEYFWNWFLKNASQYYRFEKNQNTLFKRLKLELDKIDPNLVFEFSPILDNGKRELVISADGIKSSFPTVTNLTNQAPEIDKWEIVAFRQPRKLIDQINYEGLTIKFENVFFKYEKSNGKINLELNIKGFYESAEWTAATFILLDNILGEYHTEMSLDFIDRKELDESKKHGLFPITMLPQIIQDYHLEVNN